MYIENVNNATGIFLDEVFDAYKLRSYGRSFYLPVSCEQEVIGVKKQH